MPNNFSQIDLDDFGIRIGLSNGKLLQYLDAYFDYYRDKYPYMVKFFSGELTNITASVFSDLDSLIRSAEDISNRINLNNYLLPYYKDWEISDYLEDLKMELYRMTKTSKFLRSSKANYDFRGVIEFNYQIPQNKTIEDSIYEVLGSQDYDNKSTEIAIRNDLSELDYDLRGGANLILQVQLSSLNSDIKSVVDNVIGERVYGLDIDRKFAFVDDDLKTLSYKDTIFQAVLILSNLIKGDHPEFKSFGRTNIVGQSRNIVSIPTMIREMTNVFSSDDTLTNFSIKNLKSKEDRLELEFNVNTRLELIIKQNINI